MGDSLEKLKARKTAAAEKAQQAAEREKQLNAKIKTAEKALTNAKAYAIGRMVMAEMEHDKGLAKTIHALLEKSLTTPRERELFGLKVADAEKPEPEPDLPVSTETGTKAKGKAPVSETAAADPMADQNDEKPIGQTAAELAEKQRMALHDYCKHGGGMGLYYQNYPLETPPGYWDRQERKATPAPKQTAPVNEPPPHVPNPWMEPKPDRERGGRGGR